MANKSPSVYSACQSRGSEQKQHSVCFNYCTMSPIIAMLLLSLMTMVAHAQTWTGSYTIDSSACDPSLCCCPQGILVLAQPFASVLLVNCPVNGTFCFGQSSLATVAAYPTSYQSIMNVSGLVVEMDLSPDSQVINVTSKVIVPCTATAVKSKPAVSSSSVTNKQSSSTGVLFSVILLGALTNTVKK